MRRDLLLECAYIRTLTDNDELVEIEDDNLIQKCIDNTHKIAEKIYFEPQTYGRVIPKFTAHKEFKKIFLQKVV